VNKEVYIIITLYFNELDHTKIKVSYLGVIISFTMIEYIINLYKLLRFRVSIEKSITCVGIMEISKYANRLHTNSSGI